MLLVNLNLIERIQSARVVYAIVQLIDAEGGELHSAHIG